MGKRSNPPQRFAGVLNIFKPAGCTSRDIVNRVQRVFGRQVRVGHAGTLDPMATGVLLVCIGRATKLMPVIHEFCKSYQADFTLGRSSDTDDATGNIKVWNVEEIPSLTQTQQYLKTQVGEIMQTPPAYSAVKLQGRRAYAMARKGEVIEISPRAIEIFDIEILDYQYPKLSLKIRCGSGTYIRSIARDLGVALGTGGLMHGLARTRIGPFQLGNSLAIDSWEEAIANGADPLSSCENVELLFETWDQHILSDADAEGLSHGRPLEVKHASDRLAAYKHGKFVAILERKQGDQFKAILNWLPTMG